MINNSFKFAKLEFANNIDEIPIKFNLLRYAPKNVFSWYVEKYNPYVLRDFDIGDETGYLVKLPFTADEYKENAKRCEELTGNIIEDLYLNLVEIVVFPKEMKFESKKLFMANGKTLMILLIYNLIVKSLKTVGGDLQNTEIAIIDSNSLTEGEYDESNIDDVLAIVENIYKEINHLTIFTKLKESNSYKEMSYNVFDETGLRIHISKMSKKLIAEADVVINLSKRIKKLEYHFKRGSVFIDLSSNEFARKELIAKRPDIKIIDGMRLKWIDRIYEMNSFEAGLYQKLPKYRKYLKYGAREEGVSEINSFLQNETRITSLTIFGDKIK